MTEILFDENEDWEKRILCSDESCIGTVGPDGKCRECGKTYDGVLPEGHSRENAKTDSDGDIKSASPENADTDEDWEKRILCSDGACIGTIGPDGKCRECGKPL